MTVASQKGNCVGVAPQECLIVKMGNDTDWTFLYSVIEGFNYEEGHEYIVTVRTENIDPVPADASSIKYIFMEEVSKITKESENLPFGIEENLS